MDELCRECGGIGVIKGSSEEERTFERQRQRNIEEQQRNATETARRQEASEFPGIRSEVRARKVCTLHHSPVAKLLEERDLAGLVQVLRCNEHEREAKNALKALGRDAVETLIPAIQDAVLSYSVCELLGRSGDDRAVSPLIEALQNALIVVRTNAAGALGALRPTQAVLPLIARLKDDNLVVVVHAMQALVAIGDHRAVEPLITALNDPTWQNRRMAAEALGDLAAFEAEEPLIAALKRELAGAMPGGNKYIVRDRVSGNERVVMDDSANVRETMVRALGKVGRSTANEVIMVAMRDENEKVRQAAKAALETIRVRS